MARHTARGTAKGRPGRPERTLAAWHVALALWTVFIWVHSLIPGPMSSEESLAFLRIVRPVFEALGVADADLMHTIVRKGAHFSEYLVLGVLTIIALRPRLRKPLAPAVGSVLLWVLVPCVDEFIQLHVPGRAGLVTDVIIDMSGFAVGAGFALLVRAIARGARKTAAKAPARHLRKR